MWRVERRNRRRPGGEEQGGAQGIRARVRAKTAEVESKIACQASENGVIAHAQWQARNGKQLQQQINDKGRRARQLLVQSGALCGQQLAPSTRGQALVNHASGCGAAGHGYAL